MLNSMGIREKSRNHTIYLFSFPLCIHFRVGSWYLRVHYADGVVHGIFHDKVRKSFRTSLSPHSITDCVVTLSIPICFDVSIPGLPPNACSVAWFSYQANPSVFTSVTGTRQHRVKVIIIIIVSAVVVIVVVIVVVVSVVRRNVISLVCASANASVCVNHIDSTTQFTFHIHIASVLSKSNFHLLFQSDFPTPAERT